MDYSMETILDSVCREPYSYIEFMEKPIDRWVPRFEEFEALRDDLEYVSLKSLLDKYKLNVITRKLRELDKKGRLSIFDLSDYDEFSITAPKQVSIVDFQEIIRDVANEPLNISKYLHISFLRIDLESIGLDTLDDIQKNKIAYLMENIAEPAEMASKDIEIHSSQDETKDQIIVCLSSELARIAPRSYKWGGKINRSKLARACTTQEMNYLFKNPKEEETYRACLKKLNLSMH